MVEDLLREILTELRGLRRDLARRRDPIPEVVAAIEEFFGEGRFTAAGILQVVDDEPHGPLAEALAAVVDLGAPRHSRATAIGTLLRRIPGVEVVAQQRGVQVYRLETREDRDRAA